MGKTNRKDLFFYTFRIPKLVKIDACNVPLEMTTNKPETYLIYKRSFYKISTE